MVTTKRSTAKDVDALLTVLRRHGVQQYRDGELVIALEPLPPPAAPAPGAEPEKSALKDDPLFDAVR